MISVIHCDEATIWHPVGDLDMSTVAHVRRTLDGLAGEPRIVIDLCNVGYVDSAGVGALVGALRRARLSGQRVAMCCHQPSLLRLLDMVDLTRAAPIEPDRERALRTVGASDCASPFEPSSPSSP